jgi:hypothetical protein
MPLANIFKHCIAGKASRAPILPRKSTFLAARFSALAGLVPAVHAVQRARRFGGVRLLQRIRPDFNEWRRGRFKSRTARSSLRRVDGRDKPGQDARAAH